MGKFSKSQIRSLQKWQKNSRNTSMNLSKKLKEYLENPNQRNAKSFAETFRKYYGEKFVVKYKNLSIMIYIKERSADIFPKISNWNETKNKVLDLLNKSYWEPKALEEMLRQEEPNVEKLKEGMIEGLEYKVGSTGGSGFKFYLSRDKIYYRKIDRKGRYDYKALKDFFEKVGKYETNL